jgi:serine/threonine protein kinase
MRVVATLQYEKLQQIGIGQGMNSAVYKVLDPQLGGDIVVKEIPLSKFVNSVPGYFREAQAMFAANHQNVVPVFYAGTSATDVCIAMPFYPKGSLADQLANGPLPVSEIVRIGQDVLAGLAQIHMAGYVHLDVKPSNVLISETGRGLVADFGQSRAIGPMGTANVPDLYWSCLPPEAFSGTVTLLADVFQTGLLLLRAVNGEDDWSRQLPADRSQIQDLVTRGAFPDREGFLPHVPNRLRSVIRRALTVDPAARFQSAIEFADALAQVNPPLDWRCCFDSDGATTWRAERSDRPALVVKLQPDGRRWSVLVFTERNGKLRTRGADTLCRSMLSGSAARRHVRRVLRNLS